MRQTGNIEQCLREVGYAVVPTRGTSMWPLLREGKSLVQLTALDGAQCKKGDIVLYKRRDGALVLHRIMKIGADHTLFLCGDHQWKLEEQIKTDQILAVAQGFFQNRRYVDEKTRWYQLYKMIWTGSLTIRRCCLGFLRLSGLEKRSLWE